MKIYLPVFAMGTLSNGVLMLLGCAAILKADSLIRYLGCFVLTFIVIGLLLGIGSIRKESGLLPLILMFWVVAAAFFNAYGVFCGAFAYVGVGRELTDRTPFALWEATKQTETIMSWILSGCSLFLVASPIMISLRRRNL
jgi:hypothetical protein